MDYISDNPWPFILGLVAVAVIAFMAGAKNTGPIAIGCLLLSVGLYALSGILVSPREEVQAELNQMLNHFKARDVDAIGQQISDDKQKLKDIAQKGLELVDVSPGFRIRDLKVEFQDDKTATVHVRANGSVALRKQGGGSQHIATYWRTAWKKEGGEWKMTSVTRLHPTSGEEMGYFSASLKPGTANRRLAFADAVYDVFRFGRSLSDFVPVS